MVQTVCQTSTSWQADDIDHEIAKRFLRKAKRFLRKAERFLNNGL
jgi:hypothetical protein